jgi:hypothetical protein
MIDDCHDVFGRSRKQYILKRAVHLKKTGEMGGKTAANVSTAPRATQERNKEKSN